MEIREELIRDLERRSDPYLARIDKAIDHVLTSHISSNFHEPITYATGGGKRIRPLILMLSAESVGSSEGIDLASVAIELLHTESIIHDDIIDAQTSRRDRVAFHVRYGYSVSILTADFVFGIILDIASHYNDPRVSRELSSAALRMCEGEFREIRVGPKKAELSREDYLKVISEKTASLFHTAARLGAIIGGGGEAEIEALSNYGMNLGMAYQIQDDLLDWVEDASGEGSSINGEDMNHKGITTEKLQEMARTYSARAKRELEKIGESDARSFLQYLADFTVMRDY